MVIDCHLDDKGIVRFLFVLAQVTKEFWEIVRTVQSQKMQDLFKLLGSSKSAFKGLGCIMMVLTCFLVCMVGQLSSFAGGMMCGQVCLE